MKNTLILSMLMLFLCSCGCSTTGDPPENPNRIKPSEIIEENFNVYTNSTDMSNVTISSLIKYYLDYTYGRDNETWENIEVTRNEYLNKATNQYININYPIQAKYAEGVFLKEFSEDVIRYTKGVEAAPHSYRTHFKDMSILLIKRMNDYEYDRRVR